MRNLLSYLRAPRDCWCSRGWSPRCKAGWTRCGDHLVIEADLAPEVEELLSTEAKVAIYRVCREAVHNAIKHSGGSRVVVQVQPEGEVVRFSVEDDGQGFDEAAIPASSEKGYSSLHDLRIYVESVGGRLEVRSSPDEGTMIMGLQTTNPVDLAENIGNDRL